MKPRQTRFWALLILMMIMSIAAVMPVNAYEENSSSVDDSNEMTTGIYVSPEYARDVALFNVQEISLSTEEFSEWQDASVQLSTEFYDLKGKKNAYAFDVMDQGTYLGYILISASRDNYPVLEFSKSRIPTAPSDPATILGAEIYEGKYIPEDPKPLYLGATFFYAKYPLQDEEGCINKEITVDLMDQCVVDHQDISEKYSPETEIWEMTTKNEANRLWDVIDEKIILDGGTSSSSTRSDSGYVYGVPFYLRAQMGTHGCTPTAAGMLLAFWRSNGFPSLPLGSDGFDLIEELAVAMGTNSNGGTGKGEAVGGMETVFSNHGYDSSDVSVTGDYLWVSWDACKNEIDAGRPFMLSLLHGGTPLYGTQEYGEHSVTGVGYNTFSQENYVIVHDGWRPSNENRYLAYGNWWWGTWLYKVKKI